MFQNQTEIIAVIVGLLLIIAIIIIIRRQKGVKGQTSTTNTPQEPLRNFKGRDLVTEKNIPDIAINDSNHYDEILNKPSHSTSASNNYGFATPDGEKINNSVYLNPTNGDTKPSSYNDKSQFYAKTRNTKAKPTTFKIY